MRYSWIGHKFGLLTVEIHLGWKSVSCRCECGTTKVVSIDNLRSGRTKSCGCLKIALAGSHSITHGEASRKHGESPEYKNWTGMLDRCLSPNNHKFQEYGGRGITVCDRWRVSFANFLSDMGRRPTHRHSVDRYPNNNGNYEPGNVRWATPDEQANNRRNSVRLTAFGKTLTVAEWADATGIKYGTIWSRVKEYGWTPERALQCNS